MVLGRDGKPVTVNDQVIAGWQQRSRDSQRGRIAGANLVPPPFTFANRAGADTSFLGECGLREFTVKPCAAQGTGVRVIGGAPNRLSSQWILLTE